MKKFFEKYREIIVYILVGLATTVVAYGVRLLILYPGAAILSLDLASPDTAMIAKVSVLRTVAQSLGWVAGVVFAFIPNKKWVFRNDEGGKTLWAQLVPPRKSLDASASWIIIKYLRISVPLRNLSTAERCFLY